MYSTTTTTLHTTKNTLAHMNQNSCTQEDKRSGFVDKLYTCASFLDAWKYSFADKMDNSKLDMRGIIQVSTSLTTQIEAMLS